MKKHERLIIIAAVIALLCLGIFFLFHDSHPSDSASSSSYAQFNNIDLNETKNGQIVWKLHVKHVEMSPDRNNVNLQGIEGYFKNGNTELQLTAPSGKVDRKAQILVLNGDVECTSKDGMDFHGKDVTYNGKKEILSSQKAFTAYRDNKVLTGDSFEADRVMQKVKAMGHAVLKDLNKENAN